MVNNNNKQQQSGTMVNNNNKQQQSRTMVNNNNKQQQSGTMVNMNIVHAVIRNKFCVLMIKQVTSVLKLNTSYLQNVQLD